MRYFRSCGTIFCVAALASPLQAQTAQPPDAHVDSIVLQRGACVGECRPYTLTLHSTGRVRWQFGVASDSGSVEVDSIPRAGFQFLVREAERSGFFRLPALVSTDPKLCSYMIRHAPTVTVAVYGLVSKKVVRDNGCGVLELNRGVPTPMLRLLRLEAMVDSVAGSARWLPRRDGSAVVSSIRRDLATLRVERDSLLDAIRRGSGRGSLDSQVLAARDRLRERADALTARLSDSAFQVAIWPDGARAQMLLRNAARSGLAYDTVGARLLADSLVAALKLSGIWPQPAEGDTYFSLYERWFFDVASPLVTDAAREYLSLDIEEQERRTGEDGSILIGWSTLGNRLARADRLLAANPEAPFASDLARSREQYLVLFLAGTDNSPIFTWREKQLRPEVLRSLEDFVKMNADLPAAAEVKAFLDLLRKNGYKDTPAVRSYMRKLWAR